MNGAMDSGRQRGQDGNGDRDAGRDHDGEHEQDRGGDRDTSLDTARAMDDATCVAAYVDDEMDAPERTRFEARLADDAALGAAVARERRLRARLAEAFDPVLDEPVPERLSALFADRTATTEPALDPALEAALKPPTEPKPAPSARPSVVPIDLGEERRRRRGGWMAWGGMAASLALGVLIGATALAPRGELERAADGGWRAEGALAQALDGQLSGAPVAGSATRVGLSFLSRDGQYCRAFTVGATEAGTATAGLACRGGDTWQVRQLATIASGSASGSASASPTASIPAASDAFRTAASPWPQALLDEMDRLREGDPLSSADERDAMRRHWRR